MGKGKTVKKVTGLLIRKQGQETELLVLKHPMNGLQLPAGTVEIGESPSEAILRECIEETGLTGLEIIKKIGVLGETLSDEQAVVRRMTKIFNTPSYDASSAGYALQRGELVNITADFVDFKEITCDPLDVSHQPPIRLSGMTGYVRSSILAYKIERHLFQIKTSGISPQSWKVDSDGVRFELFWAPLTPLPELHENQMVWLNASLDHLELVDSEDGENSLEV